MRCLLMTDTRFQLRTNIGTPSHDDYEVDNFYQQLQEIICQTPKKDILVVLGLYKGIRMLKLEGMHRQTGPYCNAETNERGLRLLEFATFNNLVLTNTLAPHKPYRRWTWHSSDRKHHNQIDNILVWKPFQLRVNVYRTRSFPGADIGSDQHQLVMLTFRVGQKKTKKPTLSRLMV